MALDDKGKRLHGRLDFFDRNITQFAKHMRQIVGHHRDGVAQGMEFSSKIKNIAAQEPFADLQDRLVGLAGIMENIAIERKSVMCDRATTQVLDKLAQIKTSVVAPMQVLLRDRDECVKALVKAEDKVADEKTKGVSEETSMATLERRQMLMNIEATVDNNFELFEAQRIEDLKEILEEFLRGELYYHCRALEMLGPALGHFSDVNTEAAQENMRKDIDGMNKHLRYT